MLARRPKPAPDFPRESGSNSEFRQLLKQMDAGEKITDGRNKAACWRAVEILRTLPANTDLEPVVALVQSWVDTNCGGDLAEVDVAKQVRGAAQVGRRTRCRQANRAGAADQDDVDWLSGYELKQVEWVERPLLQIAFTLLAGRPGIGKGALVARWVARCTNGEMYGEPRPAILLSTEDDPEIDLGPRIEAAGGDRSLVAMPPTSFQLPRDIDWLRGYVQHDQRARPRRHRADRDRPARQPHRRREHRPRERGADGAHAARRARQRAPRPDRRRPPPVHQGGEGRRARQGARLHRLDRRPARRARRRRRLERPGAPSRPRDQGQPRAARGERPPLPARGADAARFTESVVCAVEDGASDVDVDAELAGKTEKGESASEQARELLIETLREAGGQMESDQLDAAVAAEAGLERAHGREPSRRVEGQGLAPRDPREGRAGRDPTLVRRAYERRARSRRARGYAIVVHWTI